MQTVITDIALTDFRELAIRVRDAGLLRRRPGYYSVKISLTLAAFAAGWGAVFLVGDSWTAVAIAIFVGIMFTQLGFVGHDAGHQQVFRSRIANSLLGMGVGNVLIGISYGWWVPKHNAHHAFPNHVGRDPDLDAALVPRDGADLEAAPSRRSRSAACWRVWLFFPLMLLRSTGLHFLGVRKLLLDHDRAAAVEGLLIAAHVAVYLTIVLSVLAPLKALAFIVVQQAVFSLYLGCSFAPNHKGMPVFSAQATMSFARRQVISSRNVRGGWLTCFLLGGLNYQIEHHLFPSMPSPNFARAQSLVRSFCMESGLGYCEDSFVGSFRETLHHLRSTPTSAALVA